MIVLTEILTTVRPYRPIANEFRINHIAGRISEDPVTAIYWSGTSF